MKKVFFAAMAMVAVLFASCEKVEPTAITPDQLNATVKVVGYVECQISELDGKTVEEDTVTLGNQPIQVMVKYDAKGAYEVYNVTTNGSGYYSIDLKVAAGNSLAEIKVQAECYKEEKAVTKNREGDLKEVNAYFFGTKSKYNVLGGQTIAIDLLLLPNTFVGKGLNDEKAPV